MDISEEEFNAKIASAVEEATGGLAKKNQELLAELREKSAEFQDDVLGPTRGKLFREGMTLDRFVDESGKEYTLKQLREKDSALFKRAGIE